MAASLDDLGAMATFAKVVRLRSFSTAAKELGLSKSAVSKRIAALEERTGLRLLNRTTRTVTVTDAGEAFYVRCLRMLEEADGALEEAAAQHEEPRGGLRVNGPVLFGELHLVPIVLDLLAAHPLLQIELSLSDAFVDPVQERFDVTVRIARLGDSAMVARKLCDDRRLVVGSPAYFAGAGVPAVPTDLAGHACLRFSRIAARDEWRFLRERVGEERTVTAREEEISVPITGRFGTDSGAGLLAAVEAGLGVAMLPQFMVADSLAAGRLVAVLDGWLPRGHAIYAIHAHGRRVPPKVRVLLDALRERTRGLG